MDTERFVLPEAVDFVLERLNSRGFEAYVVGGSVRDHLMGRVPSDYDVTTNARPHQMKDVFSDCRVVETGLQHGTLTVVLRGMNIEVTTYRVDGAYDDGRHPNEVTFTASLEEDLCRRDFNVNAIAYSPRDGFVDPFDGRGDILRQRIACVGDPVKRFSEDALRILRAVRFSSALGFSIDKDTADAVNEMYSSLSLISRERIYQELTKLILGQSAREVMEGFSHVIAYAMNPSGSFLTSEDVRKAAGFMEGTSAYAEMRYAMIFGIGKDEETSRAAAKEVYGSLKPSRKSMNDVMAFIESRFADTSDEYTLKKLMGRYGEAFPEDLILFRRTVGFIDESEYIKEKEAYRILKEMKPCVTVGELAVNGGDASAAGLKGAEIGRALSALLDGVMRGEFHNEREILLRKLAEFR